MCLKPQASMATGDPAYNSLPKLGINLVDYDTIRKETANPGKPALSTGFSPEQSSVRNEQAHLWRDTRQSKGEG